MPTYVPLFSELAKDDNDAGSGQPDAPLVSAAVVNILDES